LLRTHLFPYTTLFRSNAAGAACFHLRPYIDLIRYQDRSRKCHGFCNGNPKVLLVRWKNKEARTSESAPLFVTAQHPSPVDPPLQDRKSTRLNSSHDQI